MGIHESEFFTSVKFFKKGYLSKDSFERFLEDKLLLLNNEVNRFGDLSQLDYDCAHNTIRLINGEKEKLNPN